MVSIERRLSAWARADNAVTQPRIIPTASSVLVLRSLACYSAGTMDQARIRELIALLPPGAAYPATARPSLFQPARQASAERFALAMGDPAFGWHFVEAHLKARRWLPDTLHEWPLLQAFAARHFKVADPLMLEVESFRTETRRPERDLLEALLLAQDATLARIAELLGTNEEVVEAYEALFFNVRDRRHEPVYRNALLHPGGWQAAVRNPRPDAEGDRLRLLRAGAEDGMAAVLELAGLPAETTPATLPERRSALERRVQTQAEHRMQAGCGLEDPMVRAVYTTAVRQTEAVQDEDSLALHNINAVLPALDEIRKYNSINAEARPDHLAEMERARREAEACRLSLSTE